MAKVTWTFQCLSDISDIGDYLAINSELYAERTVDLLLERGNMLENFPQMGRMVPESNLPSIRNAEKINITFREVKFPLFSI